MNLNLGAIGVVISMLAGGYAGYTQGEKHWKDKYEACDQRHWKTLKRNLGTRTKGMKRLELAYRSCHYSGLRNGINELKTAAVWDASYRFLKSDVDGILNKKEGEELDDNRQALQALLAPLEKRLSSITNNAESLKEHLELWDTYWRWVKAPQKVDRELSFSVLQTVWELNLFEGREINRPAEGLLGAALDREAEALERYLKENPISNPESKKRADWIKRHAELRQSLLQEYAALDVLTKDILEKADAIYEADKVD